MFPQPSKTFNNNFFTPKKREPISKDKIIDIQKLVHQNNNNELIITTDINIIFGGRACSGQHTTIEVLKDPCYSPRYTKLSCDQPPEVKCQTFSVINRVNFEVQNYTLRFISTPGLFRETYQKEEPKWDNTKVMTMIANNLDKEVTYLNGLILFISFEGGINEQDIQSILWYQVYFKDQGLKMALCVTHSDKHLEKEWRDHILNEINSHQELSKLIKNGDMNILFMGCVDLARYTNEEQLLEAYKLVFAMRDEMFKFIFDCKDRM
ncbi:hypothetical protein SAMD00019534_094910 [Acytostelium subglobosum LB1]|uniref:hypothetical protein n=1 Tax=Acytostelium subglobosum LB1 TaxID=1410327 RepID=UPI0006448DBB|nr:hypothetical protein SAMD00019534_094910 [Acytostelium subglobosum LB1]GAM26316.1 hypothetical protein SAMD00019534_094910 [Acytostelium subglobosum LB1]|eukprot:XP_012750870.1 hypothetical protein SAMD00019534_094910 [Acytostelium subglobosum LB1]